MVICILDLVWRLSFNFLKCLDSFSLLLQIFSLMLSDPLILIGLEGVIFSHDVGAFLGSALLLMLHDFLNVSFEALVSEDLLGSLGDILFGHLGGDVDLFLFLITNYYGCVLC